MAGLAYHVKTDEDECQFVYLYGNSPQALDSLLTVDKDTLRPVEGLQTERGLTARLALSKIVTTFRARGDWPERGSSFA